MRRVSKCFADGEDHISVQVGDVVTVSNELHFISRLEPHDATQVGYPGEIWKIAYEDRPNQSPWGITIPIRKHKARAKRK